MVLSHASKVAPIASITRLAALPMGWHARHYAVLADDILAVLVADVDINAEWERITAENGKGDTRSRLTELGDSGVARLLLWRNSAWEDGPQFPLDSPYPVFCRFADGRWLVVGSRVFDKPNARVLASNGTLITRFMLGDGIEHVAIDALGDIWVGWTDEGIDGNTQWQIPNRIAPPSSNGIGSFSHTGALIELPDWPTEVKAVFHCYNLNVSFRDIWTCPYAVVDSDLGFPLVRFTSGETTQWWRNSLAGPGAIAVEGSHALLAGGYGEDANRLALIALDGQGRGDEARLIADWRMPMRRLPDQTADRAVWEDPTLLAGHGDTLHLIDDAVWYRWRVSDILAINK